MENMLVIFIYFLMRFSMYDTQNSNSTLEYTINTREDSVDLIIYDSFPMKTCSYSLITLIHLISLTKNSTIRLEILTALKLINLCVHIDIKNIEKFPSIRRFSFENCTIQFRASEHQEDYDFYPKNLTRWLFKQGRTETFDQFISIVNHLGPLKFDLQLSDCFQPILSFNHFLPLQTQLIFLNITCEHFQIDEPSSISTRTAIYLTPTLIINTKANICPNENKYQWLHLKLSQTNFYSLRIFICENRLIELNVEFSQTTIQSTILHFTTEFSFPSLTTTSSLNRWTIPILVNFSVVFLVILLLVVTFVMFLIRFFFEKKSTIRRIV